MNEWADAVSTDDDDSSPTPGKNSARGDGERKRTARAGAADRKTSAVQRCRHLLSDPRRPAIAGRWIDG